MALQMTDICAAADDLRHLERWKLEKSATGQLATTGALQPEGMGSQQLASSAAAEPCLQADLAMASSGAQSGTKKREHLPVCCGFL